MEKILISVDGEFSALFVLNIIENSERNHMHK